MEFEKLFLEKIPGFHFKQDRKFPDRTLQVRKLWDQNIPGIPICHGIGEFFLEKIPGFYFEQGRKFQDF